MKKLIYILALILCLPVMASGATYYYYFSNAATGNADGNDGNTCVGLAAGAGDNSNACRTLTRAQAVVNALGSSDIAYLYFDQGDTWTVDSGAVGVKTCYGLCGENDDPIIHITAYGAGAAPIFDGMAGANWGTEPVHSSAGPTMWNRFFQIDQTDSTIKNIEIKNVYGTAILIGDGTNYADNITIESCVILNCHEKYSL